MKRRPTSASSLARRTIRPAQWCILAIMLAVLLGCQACMTCELGSDCDDCGPSARICSKPTMLSLARDLDELKHHIERYGSATPKVADIWSQSRLARHREEYEKMMAQEMTNFRETLQASQASSDQAYVATAMSLGAAVGGGQVATTLTPKGTMVGSTVIAEDQRTKVEVPKESDMFPKLVGSVKDDGTVVKSDMLEPGFFTKPSFTFDRYKAVVKDGGNVVGLGITLEPTVYLEQKSRYLNYLNQFRRINEGDDTADSAGYALNLVRIPVSVFPGVKTRKGYGAEVTFTMEPVLGDDLLRITFRNLVRNDLTDQLGIYFASLLNDRKQLSDLVNEVNTKENSDFDRESLEVEMTNLGGIANLKSSVDAISTLNVEIHNKTKALDNYSKHEKGLLLKLLNVKDSNEESIEKEINKAKQTYADSNKPFASPYGESLRSRISAYNQNATSEVIGKVIVVSSAASSNRPSAEPLPYTKLPEVYGYRNIYALLAAQHAVYIRDLNNTGYRHLPDIRNYLKDELEAAYRMLADEKCAPLWAYCCPELVTAIRTGNNNYLMNQRYEYRKTVRYLHSTKAIQSSEYSVTACLAWTILVQSALLNDKLIRDMNEAATSKGFVQQDTSWRKFFHPRADINDCHTFNNYVKLRWPIRVFALDPVSQDQNIGDAFSRRRETQLALSMAFASGNISARNMSRYARRLESEFNTIALNRTQVGFSHGENIFGWRFMPRFQTPDVESNLTVLGRDLLWGGPSKADDIRERCLEPGQRECVAIVLMPSFVPYAQIESVTDWFPLTDPPAGKLGKAVEPVISKDHELARAMHMSRSVKSIKDCAHNVLDANCFRDVEHQVLLKRLEQLEARLPTQSYKVQIPYENTLGGFKVFNNGITDLAPVLHGWYGAPGINLNKPTTVFLMGDHFSVHQTRVIAGGIEVNNPVDKSNGIEMLSRQVLKVTIPAGANIVTNSLDDKPGQFVDLHLATPYGVTQHLLIPAFKDDKPPITGFTIQPTQGILTTLKYKMNTATPPVLVCDSFKYDDANLEIKIADNNVKTELSPTKMKFNFKANVVLSTGEVLEVKPAIALQEIDLPIDTRIGKVAKEDLRTAIESFLKTVNVSKITSNCRIEVTVSFTNSSNKETAIDNKLILLVKVERP